MPSSFCLPFCVLFGIVKSMVIRMRHTKSQRNRVRSHHALKAKVYGACSHCKKPIMPHVICKNCGYYKDRQVIDVLAKLDKKERKKKEKELHEHEEQAAGQGGALNAEELSHK